MSSSNITVSSRNIAAGDEIRLRHSYGGKKCIWTLSFLERDRMMTLGLISPGMPATSFHNIFPSTLNNSFENDLITMYPSIPTLLAYINLEEKHLLKREQAVANHEPDPGRLSYAESYAVADTRFHRFTTAFSYSFSMEYIPQSHPSGLLAYKTHHLSTAPYESFPEMDLHVSVNIVVRMRTGALTRARPHNETDMHQLALGLWLESLWDATPESLAWCRPLRPVYLTSVLSAPFGNIPDHLWRSGESFRPVEVANTIAAREDPNGRDSMAELAQGASLPELLADLAITSSTDFDLNEEGDDAESTMAGHSGKFTAEEWAVAHFGVHLSKPSVAQIEEQQPSAGEA